MENLPVDILYKEILFRLPIQSLLTLKCVNKFFNNYISSKKFIDEHLDCSVSSNSYLSAPTIMFKNGGFLYLWNKDDSDSTARHIPLPPPFNYKNTYSTVSGACRGLLCLTMSYPKNSHSIIINPNTRKLICKISQRNSSFDDNKFSGLGLALGYDNLKDDYKLVEFAYSFRNQSSKVSVYSLKKNYWKTIDDDEGKFDCDSSIDNSVLVSDHLPHWLYIRVDRNHRSRKKKIIICLDLQKEKWKSDLKLPDFDDDNANSDVVMELGVLNGCLCLSICKLTGEGLLPRTDVWMMKEYGLHESWTKVASIMNFCHENELYCIQRVMLPRVMMGAAIDEFLVAKWKRTIPILHNNNNNNNNNLELGATSYQMVQSCEWYNITDQTTKILELAIGYADFMGFCFPSLVHPTTDS